MDILKTHPQQRISQIGEIRIKASKGWPPLPTRVSTSPVQATRRSLKGGVFRTIFSPSWGSVLNEVVPLRRKRTRPVQTEWCCSVICCGNEDLLRPRTSLASL